MDIVLLLLGFFLVILGIIGSFIPVLPGPLTSWFGLLVLHVTSVIPTNWSFLGITLGVAILIWVLDYFIPAIGTKNFGGSKYGIYGTTIGLLIGLFIPIPFGFLIGAFLGAFIGEILFDSNDTNRALKASFGSLMGIFASTLLKFSISFLFLILFFVKLWEYRNAFI